MGAMAATIPAMAARGTPSRHEALVSAPMAMKTGAIMQYWCTHQAGAAQVTVDFAAGKGVAPAMAQAVADQDIEAGGKDQPGRAPLLPQRQIVVQRDPHGQRMQAQQQAEPGQVGADALILQADHATGKMGRDGRSKRREQPSAQPAQHRASGQIPLQLGPQHITPQSALRCKHLIHGHEFLPWRAVAGAGHLGLVDLSPVAEGHEIQPARMGQSLETLASGLGAVGGEILGDSVDDGKAVGAVGADRARGATPRPAHAIEAGQDAPFLIGKAPGGGVIGHALDRGGAIADGRDHQI
ncbi:hypothetical protein E4T56_gene6448, partial [Termitomyces sp. T112]